jgi:hypothetical protein
VSVEQQTTALLLIFVQFYTLYCTFFALYADFIAKTNRKLSKNDYFCARIKPQQGKTVKNKELLT